MTVNFEERADPSKLADDFQASARVFAQRAAGHLREAAKKLDDAYSGEPLASQSMEAIHALGVSIWSAQSCVAHSAHHATLAVMWHDRARRAPEHAEVSAGKEGE